MQFSKIIILGALACFALPVSSAHALTNHVKALHKDMKACEAKAKKFADMGYPVKANKQVVACQKIKKEIAKIKTAQESVDRKIASLDDKPVKKKKHGKKTKVKAKHKKKTKAHHRAAPAQQPAEPAPVAPSEPAPVEPAAPPAQ